MFGKLIFCACVALALAQTPNPNSQDQCPPEQSHYLLPHEWDCTKFYYCEYGMRWEEPRDCAPGTEFSYELQVCVFPALANCTLSNVPPTEGTTEEPKTTTSTHKPTTTTPESTTTTHEPTTATPEPTTTTTTTPKPTTTTPEPTTTTTTPKPTTTTPEPTTTTTTPKPTTTTPEPTTTTTTTPKPTTTTPEPTTTTTTTPKPTTTTPEPTTTTTTPKPTTTTPEPTTTTTTTPKPTTTTPEPTTTTTTTPKPTTTTPEPTTITTTPKPTTTTPEPTTTTTTPKPTTTTPEPTTTTTTPKPTTTTQEPTTECPKCGLLDNGCPEDFNVFLLLPNEKNCSKFYYCNFGGKVDKDCPEGTMFNAELQVCDWPWNVNCEAGSGDGSSTTNSPSHPTSSSTSTEGPSNSTTEGPSNSTTQGPTDYTTQGPSNSTTQGPTDSTTQGPSNSTTQGPNNSTNGGQTSPSFPSSTTQSPTTEDGSDGATLPNGCPADWGVNQLLPNEEYCNKFYYCNFGDKVEKTCPEGTVFNPEISVCDWPWNVNCEAGSGDGSSTTNSPSHPTSSSTSTEGPSNSTTQGPTDSTTQGPNNSTNGGQTSPSFPSSTTQSPTTEDGSDGATLPNGCPADWGVNQLLPNEEYCNKFYYCNFGDKVEKTCPEGTVFNPEISVCDWPQNVDCGAKGTDNGTQTTENPNVLPNGCPSNFSISQLLPHEEYCNKFYYCNFGEPVVTTCPETLVFNPKLQVCDWPQNVNCGGKDTDSGSGNGNGNANDDKCKDNCNIAPWAAHEWNSFWRCEGDVAVKVNCSLGLQFNAESGTCDFAPTF